MKINVFGGGSDGAKSVGFDASKHVRVLVTPIDRKHNSEALTVARELYPKSAASDAVRVELEHAKRTIARLDRELKELEAERDAANERAAHAATGHRRFFTEVLLVPAKPGDWSGEVWLLDPVKKRHGRTLVFASVAEVRALHPELWVVEVRDDGVLLDAWGEAETRRREAAGE